MANQVQLTHRFEPTEANPVEQYVEKTMVAFGNFLLSDDRNESVSEVNRKNVTDADLENFLESLEFQKVFVL